MDLRSLPFLISFPFIELAVVIIFLLLKKNKPLLIFLQLHPLPATDSSGTGTAKDNPISICN